MRASTATNKRVPKSARDPRWAALVARDPAQDGVFFYSVASTGVYCRPSCAARLPRPENVAFYATAAEAERAGFRACKRCRPDQPPLAQRRAAQVAELCRLIDQSETAPSLAALAGHLGLSVFHTQRLFKSVTGVTPRAYAAARRGQRLRSALSNGAGVTEAIYASGYGSAGRFYEKSTELLGMAPRHYRQGDPELAIDFAHARCSLGALLVAVTARGVCAILLGDDATALERDLRQRFARARIVAADARLGRTVAQVVRLIERPLQAAALPLDIRGTLFQERVWRALLTIPAGQTVSYTELARRIGAPQAVRAVASACAQNPLAVAVPCHRVLRADGALAGYRWGLERKRVLLEREAGK